MARGSPTPAGGPNKNLIVVGVALAIFLLLLLVVQPIGDALSARGLPNGVIGGLITVVLVLLFGGTILMLARGRTREVETVETGQRAALESWARSAGWGPAPGADQPAVLERIRLVSSEALTTVRGDLVGLPSSLTLWRQEFSNRGSPVRSTVHWLTLTADGLPPWPVIGLGQLGGSLVWSKMPSRWAGSPPVALVRAPSIHPWGLTKVRVWPGRGVPPPPAWAGVAAELEAMRGWVLLRDGRLELAVRPDPEIIDPQRVIALAHRVVGLVGGLA